MPVAACLDRETSARYRLLTAGTQHSQSCPYIHNPRQPACAGGFCSQEVASLQEYRVALLALGSAHTELQTAQRQAGITPTQQGEQLLPDGFQGWQSEKWSHTLQ